MILTGIIYFSQFWFLFKKYYTSITQTVSIYSLESIGLQPLSSGATVLYVSDEFLHKHT